MSAPEAMSTRTRERYHCPANLSRVVVTYFDKPHYLRLASSGTTAHEVTVCREDLTKYRAYLWEIYQLTHNFSISRHNWKKCLVRVWGEKEDVWTRHDPKLRKAEWIDRFIAKHVNICRQANAVLWKKPDWAKDLLPWLAPGVASSSPGKHGEADSPGVLTAGEDDDTQGSTASLLGEGHTPGASGDDVDKDTPSSRDEVSTPTAAASPSVRSEVFPARKNEPEYMIGFCVEMRMAFRQSELDGSKEYATRMFAPEGAEPTDPARAEFADGAVYDICEFFCEDLWEAAEPARRAQAPAAAPEPASEAPATAPAPAPAPASAPDVSATAPAPATSAPHVSVAAPAAATAATQPAAAPAAKARAKAKSKGKAKAALRGGPETTAFHKKRQEENTAVLEKLGDIKLPDFIDREGQRIRVHIAKDSTRTFHWYLALLAYGRTPNPTISKTRFERGLTYCKVRSWFQTSSFQTFCVCFELPRI